MLPPASTPGDWPTRIGDILHNLRSALDHLALQLVLECEGQPSTGTQFPITRDNERVDIRPRVCGRVLEELRKVQPGARGVPNLDVLRLLRNIDTHRTLIPAVTYTSDVGWGLREGQQVAFVHVGTLGQASVHPGYPGSIGLSARFSIGIDPVLVKEMKKADPSGGYDVLLQGDLIHWALGTMVNFVPRVVGRFRQGHTCADHERP